MIQAARTVLTEAGAVCRRFGKEAKQTLSVPSFLFGAASASEICWLAQAGAPPPAAAIVLFSIIMLSIGWLFAKSGTRGVRELSAQDGEEDPLAAEKGGGDSIPRCPKADIEAMPARMPPIISRAARSAGELTGKELSPAGCVPDRFHGGCEALADKAGLSAREREILELLARGRNTRYIQEALVISPSTVKSHTYRIYRKLGVHSRQELIDEVEAAQDTEGCGGKKASDNKIYVFRTDGQGKRNSPTQPRRRAQR